MKTPADKSASPDDPQIPILALRPKEAAKSLGIGRHRHIVEQTIRRLFPAAEFLETLQFRDGEAVTRAGRAMQPVILNGADHCGLTLQGIRNMD